LENKVFTEHAKTSNLGTFLVVDRLCIFTKIVLLVSILNSQYFGSGLSG